MDMFLQAEKLMGYSCRENISDCNVRNQGNCAGISSQGGVCINSEDINY